MIKYMNLLGKKIKEKGYSILGNLPAEIAALDDFELEKMVNYVAIVANISKKPNASVKLTGDTRIFFSKNEGTFGTYRPKITELETEFYEMPEDSKNLPKSDKVNPPKSDKGNPPKSEKGNIPQSDQGKNQKSSKPASNSEKDKLAEKQLKEAKKKGQNEKKKADKRRQKEEKKQKEKYEKQQEMIRKIKTAWE